MEELVQEALRLGLIRPSSSPAAAPVFFQEGRGAEVLYRLQRSQPHHQEEQVSSPSYVHGL